MGIERQTNLGHLERHGKEAGYNQWGQSENGPLRGPERWRFTHEVKDRGETHRGDTGADGKPKTEAGVPGVGDTSSR